MADLSNATTGEIMSEHAMAESQPNNPLHGVTLEALLTELVAHYGWAELGRRIPIRCFNHDPGIKSSLKFLRATPWARKKIEDLYLVYRQQSSR